MREYQKSTTFAVRLIYILIISLAITQALDRLFLDNDKFMFPESENLFYSLIFFSFITRFFIGAYRVLTYDIEFNIRRAKVVIDSIGFLLQAIAFYIFALMYNDIVKIQWLIFVICVVDSIWLGSLKIFYKIKEVTFYEWMIHNLFFIVFIPLNIYCFKSLDVLLVVSILAFFVDFIYNREYYFPIENQTGL